MEIEKLSELLVKARDKSGLSQRGVADQIGIALSTYARVERGQSNFGIDDFFKLSRAQQKKNSSYVIVISALLLLTLSMFFIEII